MFAGLAAGLRHGGAGRVIQFGGRDLAGGLGALQLLLDLVARHAGLRRGGGRVVQFAERDLAGGLGGLQFLLDLFTRLAIGVGGGHAYQGSGDHKCGC
ncbi:hypothetical protein D3C71_1872810 [compost metagenome]